MPRDPELEDLDSVRRTLAGETRAFGEIVERYGDRVLAFCRSRLGSEEEAADAAQDVFLRAFRSLRSFRLGQSLPAWLFAIAANRAKTRSLRRSRERDKTDRAVREAMASPARDAAWEAELELESAALREAVRALPRDLRVPIELYYFAGLSVEETAASMRIGTEAVKSRLFRARARLRGIIEGRQPGRGSGGIL